MRATVKNALHLHALLIYNLAIIGAAAISLIHN